MKNKFFTSIPFLIVFTIINCSTNEVYGAFIAEKVSAYAALAVFSFFAFLATYAVIYSTHKTTDARFGLLSPAHTLKIQIQRIDNLGKALISFLVVAYILYFYFLLISLKAVDAFTIVLVGCLASLLNITFSMWFFKDKVKHYSSFYIGLGIALIGIVLYSSLKGTSLVKTGYTLKDALVPIGISTVMGLCSDLAKTKLRRSYGLNPELLTVMPFAAATLFGLVMWLNVGGALPNTPQVFILLYIGVLPTALFNIYSQKLKDSIGIPLVSLIQLPRPLYILTVQGVLYNLAPWLMLIPGLNGRFTNPMNQSPFAVGCMVVILLGVFLSNHYGKPLKPEFK